MTTLVLLPGLHGTAALFAPLLPHLPADLPVRLIEYAPRPPGSYSALAEEALAMLPASGDLVLLGESFSGPVAALLAATLGARVRALVLACSFVSPPRPALRRLARFLPAPHPRGLPARLSGWLMYGRWDDPVRRSALAAALAPLPQTVLRARLRAVVEVDVGPALVASSAPLLCLMARQDRLVGAAASARIRSLRGDATMVGLDGPHGLIQARPEAVAQVLLDYLARVPGPEACA